MSAPRQPPHQQQQQTQQAPRRELPPLRDYQQRIVAEALQTAGNAIVVLPTGAGKTRVAAEVLLKRREAAPSKKCIFFVPKLILLEQQAGAIEEVLRAADAKLRIATYSGGQSTQFLLTADVIVTAPVAFLAAQDRREAPGWDAIGAVVFDELHHHLGNDPYRGVTTSMRLWHAAQSSNTSSTPSLPPGIKVLGLTATLSYAMEESQIRRQVHNMCGELGVTQVSTATRAELEACGYHGGSTEATLAIPPTVTDGVLPVKERKPHLQLETFLDRVAYGEATLAAILLTRATRALEEFIKANINAGFDSPIVKRRAVKGWPDEAFKLITSSQTPTHHSAYTTLYHFYEAMRIAVTSWEEHAGTAAALYLRMYQIDVVAPQFSSPEVRIAIGAYFDALKGTEMVRLDHLKLTLRQQYSEAIRGILFCEQRVMAHILAYFISNDDELKDLYRCDVLHAFEPATRFLRMTKQNAQDAIDRFRSGATNLLVATTVAEEGMDVPAANCVIRFDPPLTPVSHVQGRGRARDADSTLLVMQEAPGRTVERLEGAELVQRRVIEEVSSTPLLRRVEPQSGFTRLVFRIGAAAAPQPSAWIVPHAALHSHRTALAAVQDITPSTQLLNTYLQKTNARRHVSFADLSRTNLGPFECTLTLLLPHLPQPLTCVGTGSTKKAAETAACDDAQRELFN